MAARLNSDLRHVAQRLASCPTAPYHEQQVRAEVMNLLRDQPGITLRLDPHGNLLARYRRRPQSKTAFALVAHLDHPGFVVPAGKSGRIAEFLGGVGQRCFRGQRVAFFHPDQPEPVWHARITGTSWKKDKKSVRFDRALPPGHFGMWALPTWRILRGTWESRACDDLAGAATLVAFLRRLARRRVSADCRVLFTRAEEVGFHGTLAALHSATLPKGLPVISVETSNARGFASLGAGPILRVGDRSSVFDSRITAWLTAAAQDLGKSRSFPFQRLLMEGGTCEGTPFHRGGHPTGAVCLALRNYHNMTAQGKIGPEAVSIQDWNGLLLLLEHLATRAKSPATVLSRLDRRLAQLEKIALHRLR